MILKIKNIGRIKKAAIEINGITVICGDNDTGKSTIGKLLYCIYASLFELPNSIRRERLSSITRSAFRYSSHPHLSLEANGNILSSLLDEPDLTEERIIKVLNGLNVDNDDGYMNKPVNEITKTIQKYMAVSDKDIVTAFLQRNINSEFGGKLANVNTPTQKADVLLEMKNGNITFHTSGKSQKVVLDQYFSLEKRLIYMDNPFILDEIGLPYYLSVGMVNHRRALMELIQKTIQTEPENVIEQIARDTSLREMMKRIEEITDGSLIYEEGEFKYRHIGLKENISLVSVSTGIKTFAILKTLLEKGYLEENGIFVMDEPEVHLHPEWQIRLAEISVLLQKAFGLNLVITTHSMEFLTAIDHFSKKYEIREKCNFYLTETEKPSTAEFVPRVVIKNTTNDLEEIYSSISKPYLKIYGEMEGD